jgi:hypothetical protein
MVICPLAAWRTARDRRVDEDAQLQLLFERSTSSSTVEHITNTLPGASRRARRLAEQHLLGLRGVDHHRIRPRSAATCAGVAQATPAASANGPPRRGGHRNVHS